MLVWWQFTLIHLDMSDLWMYIFPIPKPVLPDPFQMVDECTSSRAPTFQHKYCYLNPRNVNVNLNVPWWKRITWYDVYVIKYINIYNNMSCINMYTNQIWYTINITHTLFEFFLSTPFGFRSAAWFTAGHLLRDDSLGPPGPRPWPTDGLVELGPLISTNVARMLLRSFFRWAFEKKQNLENNFEISLI